jgi:hypothetical protein
MASKPIIDVELKEILIQYVFSYTPKSGKFSIKSKKVLDIKAKCTSRKEVTK